MSTLARYKYNDSLSKEQNVLCSHLCSMRLSQMSQALAEEFMEPNEGLLTFEERITKVVNQEWEYRDSRKFNKFLKKAGLKYPAADFDTSLYEPDRMLDTVTIERLQTLQFIDEKKNLLISGKSGAGKTYLASAFCVEACHRFYTVKYTRVNRLNLEYEVARANDTYKDQMDKLVSYDLLVIDDFGLMSLDLEKCADLFELIESRDMRNSTIILSQLPFENWYDLFADKTYADAIIRRLVAHSYRLEMNGRDMTQPS